jgi:Zn-dependent peptidase ImmA (M78 family)
VAFGVLYTPISFFTGIFMNMLSRKNEYQADRFAACLLMPWKMVLKRFDSARFKSLTLTEVKDYVLPGLAEEFAVSRSAMLIRLDQLGLLWDEHHDDQYLMANY